MSFDLNGPALEVAIGLAFVFFLLSLIVSAGTEAIAWAFKVRAKTLATGIERLLGDKEVSDAVLRHQLVQSDVTTPPDKRRPSYVSPRNFSRAMIDILDRRGQPLLPSGEREQTVTAGVEDINAKSPDLGVQLEALRKENEEIEGGPVGFRKLLEQWFSDGMDRVSGWYKRWSQAVSCLIAILVAVGLNVDTVRVAERLSEEPAVRQSVVSQAQSAVEGPAPPAGEATPLQAGKEAESAYGKLDALKLPILWGKGNQSVDLGTIAGWLITAIAISLGAPFWFDALGKIAHLKTTGKKPAAAS